MFQDDFNEQNSLENTLEGQAGKGAIAERILPSVCLHFKNFYGHFNRQKVATENLFEVPKHSGAEKCPLADLVGEVGFTCDGHASSSNRVCSKGATKIRNAVELVRYLRCGLLLRVRPS